MRGDVKNGKIKKWEVEYTCIENPWEGISATTSMQCIATHHKMGNGSE